MSVSPALKARDYKGPSSDGDGDGDGAPLIVHALRADGFDASEDGTGRGTPIAPAFAIQERAVSENAANGPGGKGWRDDGSAYTLEARTVPQAVAFTCSDQANSFAWERDVYPSLTAQIPNDTSNIQQGIRLGWRVRRLTPTECERLQGFPDGYTDIPYRNKPNAPDGPRYKALGNSMAANVMRWIGRRIEMVDRFEVMEAAA